MDLVAATPTMTRWRSRHHTRSWMAYKREPVTVTGFDRDDDADDKHDGDIN